MKGFLSNFTQHRCHKTIQDVRHVGLHQLNNLFPWTGSSADAILQCSQDGGCTTDSLHLQGPFWSGVHLPLLSGVLDSVGHSSPSKSLPLYSQNWRSALHTRSDTDINHLAGWISIAALDSGACTWNTKHQSWSIVPIICTDKSIVSKAQLHFVSYPQSWTFGRWKGILRKRAGCNTWTLTYMYMWKDAMAVGQLVLRSHL